MDDAHRAEQKLCLIDLLCNKHASHRKPSIRLIIQPHHLLAMSHAEQQALHKMVVQHLVENDIDKPNGGLSLQRASKQHLFFKLGSLTSSAVIVSMLSNETRSVVPVEPASSDHGIPTIVPKELETIEHSYRIKVGPVKRIAGQK